MLTWEELEILRFGKSKFNNVSFLRLGILYVRQDNTCDFFKMNIIVNISDFTPMHTLL